MLNQVYNMLFGHSPPNTRSERIASIGTNSKKRPTDSWDASAGDVIDADDSPARKRGRTSLRSSPTEQQQGATLTRSRACGNTGRDNESASDTDGSEPVTGTRSLRTRTHTRQAIVAAANSELDTDEGGSEYNGSDESSGEEGQHKRKRSIEQVNVRRSSRTVVLAAQKSSAIKTPQTAQASQAARQFQTADRSVMSRTMSEPSLPASGGSGTFAAYLTSAQMRRSRRSRNVDPTKELVVMLPGDDPREVPQLDLRGEVEWEEFLIAMSEDTTYLNSDNEDGGPAEHIPHSNSTYSLSCLATTPGYNSLTSSARLWSSAAVDVPTRSRNNSSSSGGGGGGSTKDAQQVQYHDILAVNNASTANEVYVPEVKEAALFKVIKTITLLDDLAANVKGPSIASRSKAKAKEQDTLVLAEQLLADKKAGGYDCDVRMLPRKMSAHTQMYVDYDADSDDEQFVRNLQLKLDHPTAGKAAKHAAAHHTNASTGEAVVLKVRCFELMITRLEREFELSRLFSVQKSLGGRTSTSAESSKHASVTKQNSISSSAGSSSSSKPTVSAPTGASKSGILAQLNLALDHAESMYELTKRFIKQQNRVPPAGATNISINNINSSISGLKSPAKETAGSKESPPSAVVAPTPRFTRNGNVANTVPVAASSKDMSTTEPTQALNFKSLEKLSQLLALRHSVGAAATSAAAALIASSASTTNLQELGSSSNAAAAKAATASSSRVIGRPPVHPRPPQAPVRTTSESSKYQHHPDNQSECSDDGPEEYFTTEQIAQMLPQASTVALLQNTLRTFYAHYHSDGSIPPPPPPELSPLSVTPKTNKTGKVGRPLKVRTASADNDLFVASVSPFGEAKEEIIVREVYHHWQQKRSLMSTSLIRAYHNYMMDLWTQADNVALPVPSDYKRGSLTQSHNHLLSVRRSLDRARLITDRVRRRERLKRDLLRLSGEQYDVLRGELECSVVSALKANGDTATASTSGGSDCATSSSKGKASPVADKAGKGAASAFAAAQSPAAIEAALTAAGQARDRAGKFLTAKQSMALLGRECAAPSKKAAQGKKGVAATSGASGSGGSKAAGKSARNQEILFSVPPTSDDEEDLLGIFSEACFSSCDSESESEASTVAITETVAVKSEVTSEPQASTPRNQKTGSTNISSGSGNGNNNISNNSRRRRSDSRSSDSEPVDHTEHPEEVEPSPTVSVNSARSNRSTRSGHSLISNTDSAKRGAKGARSRAALDIKEDDWLDDSDVDDLRAIPGKSRLSKANNANSSSSGKNINNSNNRNNSNISNSNSNSVRAPTVTPSRGGSSNLLLGTAQRFGAPSSVPSGGGRSQSGNGSAQRGGSIRSRTSVPDCSLRNLPFSVPASGSKSVSKPSFDSSNKKRRL